MRARNDFLIVVTALAIHAGCSDGSSRGSASDGGSGLSQIQIEHGIGPVSPFDFDTFDPDLAEEGATIFDVRCSACHVIGQRRIGPDLAGVFERRSPAYVMNMILNPEEMIERHPEARALLSEYKTLMADQNLTVEQARAIVEFLRGPVE